MNKELYDQIVKERPYLWWWVQNKESLSLEMIVQGVLTNGDMDDVQRLFQLVGKEQVKKIFLQQISKPRHNYRPQTINFFKKIFAKEGKTIMTSQERQDLDIQKQAYRVEHKEFKRTCKYRIGRTYSCKKRRDNPHDPFDACNRLNCPFYKSTTRYPRGLSFIGEV